MTDTDCAIEEVPDDLKTWRASFPKQQPGETFIVFQYRKLLALQARLRNIPGDVYDDWANERDRAEREIATNIAETLEDVVIKLTCLSKNMRVHGDPGCLGPILDLMLAESALTGVRESLARAGGIKPAETAPVLCKVS